MTVRTLALLVFCSTLFANAQNIPNYSGVFLRTTVESYITPPILHISHEACPDSEQCISVPVGDLSSHQVYQPQPTVLEIKQTGIDLEIILQKNGERSVAHYRLGEKSNNLTLSKFPTEDQALLKRRALHIHSIVHFEHGKRAFTEEWSLSKDLQNLTIQRKIAYQDGSEIEHYKRQLNLETALAQAASLGPDSIIDTAELTNFLIQSHQQFGYPWDIGTPLGAAVYSQFSKSAIFYANLASHSSEEPADTDLIQSHFLNLEIEVQQSDSSLDGSDLRWFPQPMEFPLWGYGFPEKLDSEFKDLRFRAKWTGSGEKDLGEIPSKLTARSSKGLWTETPPKVFYPLQLYAEDLPTSGSFEIEVLSKDGNHIAQIHGRL